MDRTPRYNSDQYKKRIARNGAQAQRKSSRNRGDVDAAFAKGGKIIEADYYVPHLAHAAMEPLVAVADFRDGKVTAWAPTQNPQAVQETVAKAVGITKENVICHVTLLGGGFGRKSKPDYVAEAAILSKKVGHPVKVVWTREDDIHFDYLSQRRRDVHESGSRRQAESPRHGCSAPSFLRSCPWRSQDELRRGISKWAWDSTDIPFDVPNLRVENGAATAQVRIGWLRSVANIYHAFAVQTFADELAHAAGRDPVDFMMELIGPPRVVRYR